MLQISRDLFSLWNTQIRYCHWKSNEHLLEGLFGETDLDVLVPLEDREKGCAIMRQLGFIKCRTQYGSRYPNVEDWLGLDESSGKYIHIHLHYQIVTGHKGLKEYSLPWSDRALASRVLDDQTGVYIAEPNLEIVTLFTRIGLKASLKTKLKVILNRFALPNDMVREIKYLHERIDPVLVYEIIKQYYVKQPDVFFELMKKEKLTSSDMRTLIKLTEQNMKNAARYSKLSLFFRKNYYLIVLFLRDRLKKKRRYILLNKKSPEKGKGISIAVIGQDGSGKSTITSDIQKWLGWKMDTCRFYFGSGDHYNPWQKKVYKKLLGRKGKVGTAIRGLMKSWLLIKWSRYAKKKIKQANRYISKGGIAIFDRFPQNQFKGINDGPKIEMGLVPRVNNSVLKRILTGLAKREERRIKYILKYQPSVVFKLLLPVEESYKRKPHENYDNICKKHQIVNALRFDNSKVYEIDATQDYQGEIICIKKAIWNHLQGL